MTEARASASGAIDVPAGETGVRSTPFAEGETGEARRASAEGAEPRKGKAK